MPPESVRVFSSGSTYHGNGVNAYIITSSQNSGKILSTISEEGKEESEDPKPNREQPWVDIIKNNRSSTNGLNIEYTAPSIVKGEIEVVIVEQDIASELKLWEHALIMYVMGGELTMKTMKKFMMKTGNFSFVPDLFYNEEGYFIIKMKSKKDKEVVLRRCPYTIFRKPMFLHE